jgi:hypothetical protein
MPPIARHPRVVTLAKELSLSARGDPVAAIRRFALGEAARIVEKSPVAITTLDVFRRIVCDRYRVKLEFIRADDDLRTIAAKYADFHSALAPRLNQEFLQDTTEGITLEREFEDVHRFRYLAVVDARGDRASRAYFTAWHEITHLVVHPTQLAFPGAGFRRTPTRTEVKKDPVETVVDHVAGHLAFYEPLFRPMLDAAVTAHGVTFRALEAARATVDPTPSIFASAMACLQLQDRPMLLVEAELAFKKSEERVRRSGQQTFSFVSAPTAKLRAVKVVPNELADDAGLAIRPNMRIPQKSVLYQAFESPTETDLTAREDQGWWDDSSSGQLPTLPISVHAARRGRYVYGFITPAVARRSRR